jgi:lipid-binding SYLF domain-containing protein
MPITRSTLARTALAALLVGCALGTTACQSDSSARATPEERQATLIGRANDTITLFRTTDSGLSSFFNNAAGYVVFPEVARGGFVVGASRGDGILFEGGKPTHTATMTAGSIGAQVGGQVFSQIIFFETERELTMFKEGRFEFDATASAVAVRAGATAAASYVRGVAVFVTGERGLMAQASIGGQKFTATPLR